MTAAIEPGHVMSIQAFNEMEARPPASEATKHRRCVADDIRSMKGPHNSRRSTKTDSGETHATPA